MAGGDPGADFAGGGSSEPAAAWLSTLVFEALDKVASPQARNELIRAALAAAGAPRLPGQPDELLSFAVGPLRDVVAERLGDAAADALVQDLEPLLQHAAASEAATPAGQAPEREPEPEPEPERDARRDATSTAKRQTLPTLRRQPPADAPAPDDDACDGPHMKRGVTKAARATFPYSQGALLRELSKHIVLVDDERAFLAGYAGVFRERGYEVFTAPAGEAVHLLCKRLEPEFVLIDLAMPELKTGELLRWLEHEMGERAPAVVLLTDPDRLVAFDSPLAHCFDVGTNADALLDALRAAPENR